MLPIINRNCIFHETSAMTKNEILSKMVKQFEVEGYLTDTDAFYEDILKEKKYFRLTLVLKSVSLTAKVKL